MKLLTNLDLSRNEIKNVVIHNLPSHPSEQKEGQVYFNTSQNQHYAYRNGKWTVLGSDSIADIIGLQDALDSKGSIENEHNHKNKTILDGIDEDRVTKWDNSVEDAKDYTDARILEINGGAPSSSNSLKKISDILDAHKESIDTLDALAKTKADDREMKVALDTKANKEDMNRELALKAVKTEVNNALSLKADAEETTNRLAQKADKTETEIALSHKVDNTYLSKNYYTGSITDDKLKNVETNVKTYVDELCETKASVSDVRALSLTKADDAEIKSILATKANLVEVNNELSAKADAETVNSELEKKALKSVVEQMNVDLSNAINTKMDIHAHPYKSENWYPTWNDVTDKPTIPTKTSQLTNDSNFLTEHQDISGKADKTELHNHSNKSVLDNITSAKVTEWNSKSTFSGSYNDLTNKPNLSDYAKIEDLGYITPQMFGAKADGVTDDSEAILKAIAALPKDGGTLYFPAGTYIHGDGTTTGLSYQVDTKYPEGHAYYPAPLMQNKGVDDKIGRSIKFDFEGYTNLTIKGDGAVIQSHESNGECSNNRFFTFKRCENVIIEGITIDGKRHERGIKLSDYSPGGYDLSRTNIQIDKCKRVIIRNVISKGAMMDGLAIGHGSITDYSEDILVEKCKFLDNHRQGISIEGATNVTVRDTECSYNGIGQGILPKSGIDVEAYGNVGAGEQYSYNHNVLIDKCYFVGNGYSNVVVNNNSFNTVIQHCTFKDAWVSAQPNGDAKLLYCKMENCGISNGYRYIAHNEIIYNKGGYVMRSTDVSENTISYIEHNTFDLSGSTSTYNSIRLTGKERFRYNHIKNATSNTVDHYPLLFTCEEFIGNKLELTETCSNIDTYIKAKSSANLYKDNTNIGYASSRVTWNEFYRTDETITRSFNSRNVGYGKLLKLSDFAGIIKMTARYGNQVEEVFICRSIGTYCHHYVFRRNTNLSGQNVVNIYKDSGQNFYVKFSFTNTNVTVECSYCYGESSVEGLQYADMFTTTTVAESSLTKINAVDTSVFTTSLKTNYDKAYTHSTSSHAPANAQKNSDITKAEIEAKLTGIITSHSHEGIGDYVENNWGSENAGKVLMVGADGRVSLYDLSNFDPNAKWFTVTQNYTNVEGNFNSTKAKENLPLTIKLNTTNGKKFGNVSVIMNGVDVTSKVYSNGIINIEAVLGDIVITADAMLYTNVADPTNPEWVNGSRYNNYGNPMESPYGIISNSIPVKAGDTIRIKGLASRSSGDIGGHVVMKILKKNGDFYYAQCLNTINGNGFFGSMAIDKTNGMATVVLENKLDVGSITIAGDIIAATDSELRTDTVIVTINEEIV